MNNYIPTDANLLDYVKQINGVGEEDNSYLSETWSSKLATAFYEYEQEQALDGQFEVTNYGGSGKLNDRFKAIALHMKSRGVRKVNRDIYVGKYISLNCYTIYTHDLTLGYFLVLSCPNRI